YTSKSGGSRVSSSTKVTQTRDHTLYAHWSRDDDSSGDIIVTFNPNGGTVKTDEKKVTEGKTYGTLPTPTRSG
ncbi:MAG: InlB B-repeat-containing protein, partial [Oscillospiraceae bacterium]|nr:InlB B-repeat-containing protein [Oscillospiraceae bacterium]